MKIVYVSKQYSINFIEIIIINNILYLNVQNIEKYILSGIYITADLTFQIFKLLKFIHKLMGNCFKN